jgi:hypothetical protein
LHLQGATKILEALLHPGESDAAEASFGPFPLFLFGDALPAVLNLNREALAVVLRDGSSQ